MTLQARSRIIIIFVSMVSFGTTLLGIVLHHNELIIPRYTKICDSLNNDKFAESPDVSFTNAIASSRLTTDMMIKQVNATALIQCTGLCQYVLTFPVLGLIIVVEFPYNF